MLAVQPLLCSWREHIGCAAIEPLPPIGRPEPKKPKKRQRFGRSWNQPPPPPARSQRQSSSSSSADVDSTVKPPGLSLRDVSRVAKALVSLNGSFFFCGNLCGISLLDLFVFVRRRDALITPSRLALSYISFPFLLFFSHPLPCLCITTLSP